MGRVRFGPKGNAAMYHVTISTPGGTRVVEGPALPGERWRVALLRIYQAALPADAPVREIVQIEVPSSTLRIAATSAVLGYFTPNGLRVRDPEVRITLEPPQPY
jgi:hypothetical protein